MWLLHFAKKYYDFINYDDETVLQVSFRNVQNYHITGFNQTKGMREWRYHSFNDIPKNKYHNNFKIIENFIPSSLTDITITEICKNISERILLAFGINDDTICFIDDEIDINTFSHIHSH